MTSVHGNHVDDIIPPILGSLIQVLLRELAQILGKVMVFSKLPGFPSIFEGNYKDRKIRGKSLFGAGCRLLTGWTKRHEPAGRPAVNGAFGAPIVGRTITGRG